LDMGNGICHERGTEDGGARWSGGREHLKRRGGDRGRVEGGGGWGECERRDRQDQPGDGCGGSEQGEVGRGNGGGLSVGQVNGGEGRGGWGRRGVVGEEERKEYSGWRVEGGEGGEEKIWRGVGSPTPLGRSGWFKTRGGGGGMRKNRGGYVGREGGCRA